MSATYDYIVIGAGSAGCVLASRLSEDPDRSVLLIEAGPSDDAPELHAPEAWPALMGSEYDWNYTSTAQSALGRRCLKLPRGRTLGGSSATNVMLYVRGDANDYRHWSEAGNAGWSFDDLSACFRRMERYDGSASAERGTAGPLRVTEHAALSNEAKRFLAAAIERGHLSNPDYNRGSLVGCAPLQSTIFGKRRQSSAKAYLGPALERGNLAVMTGCEVTRIRFRNGGATGVDARANGQDLHLAARRETVLCAGAFNTPKLLLISGVGPAEDLAELAIETVADLPGVGRNLSDHPLVPLGYKGDCVPGPGHSGVEAVVFGRFDGSSSGGPDYQISFGSFLFFPPEISGGSTGCTLGVSLCQPESKGSVRLNPDAPRDEPLIDCGFLRCESDLEGLGRAVGEAERIAGTAGWLPLVGPAARNKDARKAFVRSFLSSNHHACGTCRMGTDDGSVVGPDLKVHGIDGLRIADASIMPRIVSGNPNATAMVIGEKAADLIKASGKAGTRCSSLAETVS